MTLALIATPTTAKRETFNQESMTAMTEKMVRVVMEKTIILQSYDSSIPNAHVQTKRQMRSARAKANEFKLFMALSAISLTLSLLLFLDLHAAG
ncbi:MAG: hypothetical protein HQL81_03200 [Magnetococcales bacterium]|nr:hypothetical protein [Magnetococcales bacterium]